VAGPGGESHSPGIDRSRCRLPGSTRLQAEGCETLGKTRVRHVARPRRRAVTPASRELAELRVPGGCGSRQAFFRGLRDVIDLTGQAVSALSRCTGQRQLPTLIVWGAQDHSFP